MIKEPDPRARRVFKSRYTGPEYKKAICEAYRLGFIDGGQKREEMFNFLQLTNRRLWEELIRLDKKEPLDGVTLSLEQTGRLMKHLRNAGIEKHKHWVEMLRKKLKKSDRSVDDILTAVGKKS